jgi:hypothetical protein
MPDNDRSLALFRREQAEAQRLESGSPVMSGTSLMKDFANAAFAPDQIKMMGEALDKAVEMLPEPVSAHHVQDLAESILRSTKQGETDPRMLQAIAMVEMLIRSDG